MNQWLTVALRASAKDILALNREGTTVQSVKYDTLKEFELPVPPLAEQRRIVAKVEQLVGKVDACQKRLVNISGVLKRFRRSVLAAACSGRLTADWRDQNPDVETALALAQRIEEIRKKQANRRLPPTNVEVLLDEDCPEEAIPGTWRWVHFGSVIGELRNGVSLRPDIDPPGVPILRISAARPGSVDLAELRYMPNGDEFLPLYAIKDDDLLFTRYNGSIELLGVCGRVRGLGRKTLLYPDKLMRVRFDHGLILPAYAEIFFQVPAVHERIVAKSKSSAGQNGVSGSDIKAQPFALPPLAEQQEIVRRAEVLFTLADQLEGRLAKAQAQVEKLTPSLLARAFSGELVPTEAELARQERRDFEPAAVLVERIQRERNGGRSDTREEPPLRIAGVIRSAQAVTKSKRHATQQRRRMTTARTRGLCREGLAKKPPQDAR